MHMGMRNGQTDEQHTLKVWSSLVQGRTDGQTDRQTVTTKMNVYNPIDGHTHTHNMHLFAFVVHEETD